MEERKWEYLNEDCLVNIFGRLDVESLLLDVPLVCKQWYQATFNPLSWQNIVFPVDFPNPSRLACEIDSRAGNFSYGISKLIKFVVGRSQGCATTIVLPSCISREDLIFVSDKCPSLEILAVSDDLYVIDTYAGDLGCAVRPLCQMEKFASIDTYAGDLGFTNMYIDQEVASAIVSNLATIKRLVLDETHLEKVNLELILRGCKELEMLYVRYCVGFDEDDEEILMLASGIKDFQCEGSTSQIYDYDYFPYYDDIDVYEDHAIYFDD